MEGNHGGRSSVADVRARVGSDVNFGRGCDGRPRLVFPGEEDELAAIPRWEYRDYAK